MDYVEEKEIVILERRVNYLKSQNPQFGCRYRYMSDAEDESIRDIEQVISQLQAIQELRDEGL